MGQRCLIPFAWKRWLLNSLERHLLHVTMKTTYLLISAALVLAPLWSAERPWKTRQDLLAIQGDDHDYATALVKAIDSGDQDTIRATIRKTMEHGHSKLVGLLLRYPAGGIARREAATAFGELKGVAAARQLLQGWDIVEYATVGLDGAAEEQKESRKVFERSLSKVTGVKPDASWTTEQKQQAFAAWIATNDDHPKPPPASMSPTPMTPQPAPPVPKVESPLPVVPPPVVEHSPTTVERQTPVWLWIIGSTALAVVILLALKRRG